MSALRPAVFLDRDGTIIVDRDYPGDPGAVALLPGAAAGISRLNAAGILVIVITNQSGIGRGLLTEEDYVAVHERMIALLEAAGARIDAVYHCPHAPDHDPPCECRKPAPGMYRRAAREHGIDLARSFYIGDRRRDLEAGIGWGGRGYFIGGTAGEEHTPFPAAATRVGSLREAVEHLLGSGSLD